jgi:hypothetical protein
MANLKTTQIDTLPTGKFYTPGLGTQSFYGRKEISKKDGVVDFTFAQAECDETAPCSLKLENYVRDYLDARSRFKDRTYNDKETVSGVYKGTVKDKIECGRLWSLQMPVVSFNDGIDWGDETKTMLPAFSGLAFDAAEKASFASFATLQQMLGQHNGRFPPELMASVRILNETKVNSVRFVWRLAAMYVACKLTESVQGGKAVVTNVTQSGHIRVNNIEQYIGILADGVNGTKFVPYVQQSMSTMGGYEANILYLAASTRIEINNVEVRCWPQIGGAKFLYYGTAENIYPASRLHSAEVWQTAVNWCRSYSSIELLNECLDAVTTMVFHDGGNMCFTNLKDIALELPRARMQGFALSILLNPPAKDSVVQAEPKFAHTLEYGLLRAQILSVLQWYWVWHGPVFYSRLSLLDSSDMINFFNVIIGVRGQRPIWGIVQHMLKQLSIDGHVGRIFCTVQTTKQANAYFNAMRKHRNKAVQWDELVTKLPKISSESALWGRLYPLVLEERYIPHTWGKVAAIKGARSPAECMYSLYSRETQYRIRVENPLRDERTTLDYRPDVSYSGEIADYQFFTTNDKYARTYTPMFKLNSNDLYHMMCSPDAVRFHLTWYRDRTAVPLVNDNVDFNLMAPQPKIEDGIEYASDDEAPPPAFEPGVPPVSDFSGGTSDYQSVNPIIELTDAEIALERDITLLQKAYREHGGESREVKKLVETLDRKSPDHFREFIDGLDTINILKSMIAIPQGLRFNVAKAWAHCIQAARSYTPAMEKSIIALRAAVAMQTAAKALAKNPQLNKAEADEAFEDAKNQANAVLLADWAARVRAGEKVPQPKVIDQVDVSKITNEQILMAVGAGIPVSELLVRVATNNLGDFMRDVKTRVADVVKFEIGFIPTKEELELLGEDWQDLLAGDLAGSIFLDTGSSADNLTKKGVAIEEVKDEGERSGSDTQQNSLPEQLEKSEPPSQTSTQPVAQDTPSTGQHTSQTFTITPSSSAPLPGSSKTPSAESGQDVEGFTFTDPQPGGPGSTPSQL